jgi:uncharacterized FAD-dependent dehydrogenase
VAIRVSNLRLGLDESEETLRDHAARLLGLHVDEIARWRILRKSFDARDKNDLAFVYSAELTVPDQEALLRRVRDRHPELEADHYTEPPFEMPENGNESLRHPPVVVGSGPGGLAAAYFLARHGYRPIVLERGKCVRDRIHDVHAFDQGGEHDPESNYLFGEGGAGTFSDGKLTCRSSGPDVRRILELFAECKGKPSILYDHRPHLGSNRLPAVVKALRQRIEAMGGTFRFLCRMEDLHVVDGCVHGVATSSGFIPADVVLLAIGHSARDTYEMLHRRGVPMEAKPFQLGVRIEQPQSQVNRQKYGKTNLEERLGAADYSVNVRARGAQVDLFSFCMCAGGYIMPSVSEPEHFCTNGMSLSRHDSPFANSGLVVTLDLDQFESRHPLAGMMLQRKYEARAYAMGRGEYLCPIQTASDFLARRKTKAKPACSYPRGLVPGSIETLVPPTVARALHEVLPILDRRWHGRFLLSATLVAPEARGSSPVRLPRDPQTRESPGLHGCYPVGEGAGYAGGIVSAAVDGLRTARAIIARFARV